MKKKNRPAPQFVLKIGRMRAADYCLHPIKSLFLLRDLIPFIRATALIYIKPLFLMAQFSTQSVN